MRSRAFRIVLLTHALSAVRLLSVQGAGSQPDEFTKPLRLSYGDPKTVAPMMGPCLTIDWDRDGRPDVISSPHLGKREYQLLFRNLGVKDGKLVLDLQPKRIRLAVKLGRWSHFAMCEPVDFDRDGTWEVIAGIDRGHIYYWRE